MVPGQEIKASAPPAVCGVRQYTGVAMTELWEVECEVLPGLEGFITAREDPVERPPVATLRAAA